MLMVVQHFSEVLFSFILCSFFSNFVQISAYVPSTSMTAVELFH